MLRRLQYVGAGAIMIPNHRHAQQRNATRSADIRAVSAFWARAERYRGEQLEAAKAILETPASIARNGGEASATVVWARMAVRRANEAAQWTRARSRRTAHNAISLSIAVSASRRLRLKSRASALRSVHLRTAEVAGLLRISSRTVRLWAECREVPALKVGRQWRFRYGDIALLIDRPRNGVIARDPKHAWINNFPGLAYPRFALALQLRRRSPDLMVWTRPGET